MPTTENKHMLSPSRRGAVPSFLIMETFREANELARQGGDIIHLSLGQPGREVPPEVLARVGELLSKAKLGYTEATGMPELKARIAHHYQEWYGVRIPQERIFVTLGSSAAFILGLLAAFEAGDRVAITRPCYPAYPNMMTALGLEPTFLRGTFENRFQPTLAMLEALPEKPKGLVIGNPSNPAGTVVSKNDLQALAAYARAQGIRLVVDEIYHGITYGEPCQTVAAFTEEAFIVNSFSKYFLMPGWRLGWAVVPPDLVGNFTALAQNFFISPSAIAQLTALEVFNHPEALRREVALYARNRAILLEELPKAGFTRLAPAEGGFFIYADISHFTDDSIGFCRRMMHETGVVSVPGVDFDAEEGKRYLRFSFSNTEENIREAMRRLQAWMPQEASKPHAAVMA